MLWVVFIVDTVQKVRIGVMEANKSLLLVVLYPLNKAILKSLNIVIRQLELKANSD